MSTKKIRAFAPLRDLSLEKLVPKGNYYYSLEKTLGLYFVRELVRPLYTSCGGGRRSIDRSGRDFLTGSNFIGSS